MGLILSVGIFLRIFPTASFPQVGYDEHGYMVFVQQIEKAGIWNYDAVIDVYKERQYKIPQAVVPATRLGFLIPAALSGSFSKSSRFGRCTSPRRRRECCC